MLRFSIRIWLSVVRDQFFGKDMICFILYTPNAVFNSSINSTSSAPNTRWAAT